MSCFKSKLLITLWTALLVHSAPYAFTAESASGLVVRYPFDGHANNIEENAIGDDHPVQVRYHGHYMNSRHHRAGGLFGNALRITEYNEVRTTFPSASNFTITTWIKYEGELARDRRSPVIDCAEHFQVGLERDGSSLFLYSNYSKGEQKTNIPKDKWFALGLVADGENLTLYIDGEPQGQVPHTSDASQSTPEGSLLYVGSTRTFSTPQELGYLDEFRIYDRALHPEAISQLSDRTKPVDQGLPPVADAGINHTLFAPAGGRSQLELRGVASGATPESFGWEVTAKPEGADVHFAAPSAKTTQATFSQPGDYELRFTATNTHGTSADRIRVVVFPPHPKRPPAKLFDNPWPTNTHNPGFHDNRDSFYTQEFVDTYFKHVPPPLKEEGYAGHKLFKAPPPPYQHPRLFFNHEDLADIRHRLRYTKAGQSAYLHLRNVTPYDRMDLDDIPIYCSVTRDEDGKPLEFGGYTVNVPQLYCNAAFQALIEADTQLARKMIEASKRMLKDQRDWNLMQRERKAETNQGVIHFGAFINCVGRYALAYVYDFLYPWMTEAERTDFRQTLASATQLTDGGGMWSVPGGWGKSNLAAWWTGNQFINVSAIEGEDGFDPVVQEEALRAYAKVMSFGINPDGSPGEGLGKMGLGPQNMIAMAKRGTHAFNYQSVYNHMAKYAIHGTHPSGDYTISDDIWIGSRWRMGLTSRADAAALKYCYPDDPVIDLAYRTIIRGEKYLPCASTSVHGYSSGIVNCITARDWTGDPDYQTHALAALAKEPLSNLFNYTNLATTRTSWTKDAAYLYFNARIQGGHRAPSRGSFVFCALGRDWNMYPAGRNTSHSLKHNVITVDGVSAGAEDARFSLYNENDHRVVFGADLRTVYGDYTLASMDAHRLHPTPEPWNQLPQRMLPFWGDGNVAYGGRFYHCPLDVEPDYPGHRYATLVKGAHPYAIISDRMEMADGAEHHYRWQMVLPDDLTENDVEKISAQDILITDPTTGNRLLVRYLGDLKGIELFAKQKTTDNYQVVGFESTSTAVRSDVLLLPLKAGADIPAYGTVIPALKETVSEIQALHNAEMDRVRESIRTTFQELKSSWGVEPGAHEFENPIPIDFASTNHVALKGEIIRADNQRIGNTYYLKDPASHLMIARSLTKKEKGQAYSLSLWVKNQGKYGGEIVSHNRSGVYYHRPQGYVAGPFFPGIEVVGREWSHIMLTYDADNTIRTYIDGELKGTGQPKFKETSAGTVLGKNFQGWIDHFQYFDRVIEADQIRNHFRSHRLHDIQAANKDLKLE